MLFARPLYLKIKRRTAAAPALAARPRISRAFGGKGYIAGTGTGIVTVGNPPKPAARLIIVQVRGNLRAGIVRSTWSKPDGTYLIGGLDPAHWYVVTVLDNHDARHGSPYPPYSAVVKPFVDT